ncbi:serine-rich adhesin for platelets isoform X2 [Trachinotus anak]
MVQVSQSKQPRVENTHEDEKQNEDGFDFSFSAELQNKQKDQKTPCKKPNVTSAENVVEQVADSTTQDHDAANSDMDACRALAVGHAVENASAPKGWVIGPLFQSFKSKMASFTEIVMSPVKLFRANSPPPSMDPLDKFTERELQADGTADDEPNNMFQPVGESENGNQEAEAHQQSVNDVEGAQSSKTGAVKYCKKLAFDVELSAHSSEQTDECGITQKEKNSPDSVPLQDSPLPCIVSRQGSDSRGSVVSSSLLLQPSINSSASHESTLKISSAAEEQGKQAVRLKPLPRKRTGNRSELKKVISKPLVSEAKKEESDPEQLPQRNSVETSKTHSSDADKTQLLSPVCYTDRLQPDGDDDESCNIYTPAGLGRSKRGLKQSCHPQEPVKRKKPTRAICTEDTKNKELLNVASDSGAVRGLRPPKKEVLSTNVVDGEETLKPPRKRQTVSTRGNTKGKGGQEMLPTVNEAVLNTRTENSPDAVLICLLDKSSGVSENNQKSSSKTKPSGSCKRLKTRAGLSKSYVNIDSMDLETTVAITSTKQEPLPDIPVCPDTKQLQSTVKCRNINKKPLKRKSLIHPSSATDSGSSLVSATSVLSVEPSELTPTDFNTSLPVKREENLKTELNQPSKRSRKGCRGAVKSSDSGAAQETKQCINNLHLITKESQSNEGKGKISMDPVYFEMTPFESNHQPAPPPSQPHLEFSVQLYKQVEDEEETSTAPAGEVFPPDPEAGNHSGVSRLRPSARRVNVKPRRADKQRRRCRVLHRGAHKGEEMTNSITMEDADLATASTRSSENTFSRRLLRSYSCPEIPSLCSNDTPWTSSLHSPHHSRTHTSHQHKSSHTPVVPHAHKSLRRARRHTVCSVEVEREIAPLCLRKEVYPSRRSALYDGVAQHLSPILALSPSTSLSALASCFLSSPLAFLSKRVESRGAAASASTSSHASSPTSSSSLTSPLSSSTWHLPGFLLRSDSSHVTSDSSGGGNPLECEIERSQQSEEEDDGEDTSSSSQEYEDAALREEKALSDSEIKMVQKHEERGKVSSIRIRKTLPKPQNNLTPMGLPKPIRLKKKDFSLEEIYTNKNFSKPPESRLETIFEVPLNRRNGSESWFGQKRIKRFLEFLEVGEARKPKKPLVGVGKAGISSSRTRRGGFAKDEASLGVQDVDSLLCAKLDQLSLWLMHDQKDS